MLVGVRRGREKSGRGVGREGRGQIKHCSISAKQPAFYRSRNNQQRMEREMAGRKICPGEGWGGAEGIVKIIRVRHTSARVRGETFRGNLSGRDVPHRSLLAHSEGRFGGIKAARGHFAGVGG